MPIRILSRYSSKRNFANTPERRTRAGETQQKDRHEGDLWEDAVRRPNSLRKLAAALKAMALSAKRTM